MKYSLFSRCFSLKFKNCLWFYLVQLIQDVQCSQAMYSRLLKIGKVLRHFKILHLWGSNSIEFPGLKGWTCWRTIYLPGPWEMAGYWPADVHLQCGVGPVRNIIIINTVSHLTVRPVQPVLSRARLLRTVPALKSIWFLTLRRVFTKKNVGSWTMTLPDSHHLASQQGESGPEYRVESSSRVRRVMWRRPVTPLSQHTTTTQPSHSSITYIL